MKIELIKDLKSLLETFLKHKDGYEKASSSTEDKELKKILSQISDYKAISTLDVKNILNSYIKSNENSNDLESSIKSRNISKILNSIFKKNDNKFIIEACLIKENSLNNELKSLLEKNYNDIRLNMVIENNISQCFAVKSLLWEQSSRF